MHRNLSCNIASATIVVLATIAVVALTACGGANTQTTNQPAAQVPLVLQVSVVPSTVQVAAASRFQFLANIVPANGLNAVAWTVSGAGCSAATCGTIEPSGRYLAPTVVPSPATVTVTATSTADPTKLGTASVTISPPPIPTMMGPVSVAVAREPSGKFGKFAYVANCGSNNVSMYTINATTGALTFIGTVPADFCPLSVTVDPFGKFAYVTNAGGGEISKSLDGNVSMYVIDPGTGALTPMGSPVEAGTCANSVAVDPLGKFVYVTYSACGDDVGGVPMYKINATTGALTSIGMAWAGEAPLWVAVHPSGKFAYVANGDAGFTYPPYDGSNNVSMFTIDATTGALRRIGTIAAGSSPSSIAIDPLGKFAYLANRKSNDVSMYTIDATTGTLGSIGPIVAGTGPASVAVDPTGKFAYVANAGSNNVSMYTVDVTTGVLISLGTVAAGLSPSSIAIDPSGKFAYVTNFQSNNVSMYSIDPVTGALTLIGQAAKRGDV